MIVSNDLGSNDLGRSPAEAGSGSRPSDRAASTGVSPAVAASIPNALRAMDDWCRNRAERLSSQCAIHLRKGRSLIDPGYRALFGEHRAYMAMRSYIHGSMNAQGIVTEGGDPSGAPVSDSELEPGR